MHILLGGKTRSAGGSGDFQALDTFRGEYRRFDEYVWYPWSGLDPCATASGKGSGMAGGLTSVIGVASKNGPIESRTRSFTRRPANTETYRSNIAGAGLYVIARSREVLLI
jgi:hypothetical protein